MLMTLCSIYNPFINFHALSLDEIRYVEQNQTAVIRTQQSFDLISVAFIFKRKNIKKGYVTFFWSSLFQRNHGVIKLS